MNGERENAMGYERMVGTRRPNRHWMFDWAGRLRPIRRRWGRPYLPPHWKPKDDADELVRRREELEILEELEQSGAMYRIIW